MITCLWVIKIVKNEINYYTNNVSVCVVPHFKCAAQSLTLPWASGSVSPSSSRITSCGFSQSVKLRESRERLWTLKSSSPLIFYIQLSVSYEGLVLSSMKLVYVLATGVYVTPALLLESTCACEEKVIKNACQTQSDGDSRSCTTTETSELVSGFVWCAVWSHFSFS